MTGDQVRMYAPVSVWLAKLRSDESVQLGDGEPRRNSKYFKQPEAYAY